MARTRRAEAECLRLKVELAAALGLSPTQSPVASPRQSARNTSPRSMALEDDVVLDGSVAIGDLAVSHLELTCSQPSAPPSARGCGIDLGADTGRRTLRARLAASEAARARLQEELDALRPAAAEQDAAGGVAQAVLRRPEEEQQGCVGAEVEEAESHAADQAASQAANKAASQAASQADGQASGQAGSRAGSKACSQAGSEAADLASQGATASISGCLGHLGLGSAPCAGAAPFAGPASLARLVRLRALRQRAIAHRSVARLATARLVAVRRRARARLRRTFREREALSAWRDSLEEWWAAATAARTAVAESGASPGSRDSCKVGGPPDMPSHSQLKGGDPTGVPILKDCSKDSRRQARGDKRSIRWPRLPGRLRRSSAEAAAPTSSAPTAPPVAAGASATTAPASRRSWLLPRRAKASAT